MNFFGYDVSDFIPCEFCGKKAVDIHHLEPKSRAKHKVNMIDNLMALCRECHHAATISPLMNENFKAVHRKKLLGSKHDNETERYV